MAISRAAIARVCIAIVTGFHIGQSGIVLDNTITAAGTGLQFHLDDHALFSDIIDVTIGITEWVDLLWLVAFPANTLLASVCLTVSVIAAWARRFIGRFESAVKTGLDSTEPSMSYE